MHRKNQNKYKVLLFFMIVSIILIIIMLMNPISNDAFNRAREYRNQQSEVIIKDKTVNVNTIDPEYIINKKDSYIFLSIFEPHIEISGFPFLSENRYDLKRLEKEIYYSPGIERRNAHTAGGKLRFQTDAKSIYVKIKYDKLESYSWFALTGSAGLDIYLGNGDEKKWIDTVYPNNQLEKNVEKKVEIDSNEGLKDVTINLPLYASIDYMEIGLPENSNISLPTPYRIENPIVFYGSSITQGCSSSRSGTTFPEIISRYFDSNMVNLGFSSSCKGEISVADSIAKIQMSALVMEFDHNVDTVEELAKRYNVFYQRIRTAHPDIPIILLSRISGGLSCSIEETNERDKIINNVYKFAINSGDRHTYFIDGCNLSNINTRDLLLVDGKHPNDRGMAIIAEKIIEVLNREWRENEAKYQF